MKRCKLTQFKFVAATAVGVVLGRGAPADTIVTFDAFPPGVGNNFALQQISSFGDNVAAPRPGIAVSGFGTPDIGLTWAGVGSTATQWEYYIDDVWSAGQLNGSAVGATHQITFTPGPATQVSIKSFNFHPYYNTGSDYAYDWNVTDGTNNLANGSLTFPSDAMKDHPVNINYTGAAGLGLRLRITRTGGSDDAQNIAVDDIRFAQLPEPMGPIVTSISPQNGQTDTRPDAPFDATLTNGLTQLVPGTIQLLLNGAPVAPLVTPSPGAATVSYRPPALLPAGSTNRYRLIYGDSAARSYTNEVQFVVFPYVNIELPAPLYLETFDNVAEGGLPAGWTTLTYTPGSDTTLEATNLNSAFYDNWVVVNSDRFKGVLLSYSGGEQTEDYQRVLTPNYANVVNGKVIDPLAQTNILFGDSGYRSTSSQVLYAFTRDYDLTGRTNVYLSFHSLYEQNQDSIGAVEYSIDEGATWLPVVYLLDGDDVVVDAFDNVNAVATLTTNRDDIATYTDPMTLEPRGGNYGAFIGAPISQSLAPYISARVNDDPLESKRVELFRLPAADNRPKVRFRLAYAGTDSWYFGIDDFGLYSLPTAPVSIVQQPPALLRLSAGSIAILSAQVAGTPPFSYQWRSNGVDIAGATDAKLILTNLQSSFSATYSVRVSNAGGSVVSDGSALQVFAPRLTGQWDFDQGDLRATAGQPLEYRGDTAAITVFTNSFFIDEFENGPVMCFTNTEISQGYIMRHGAQPNGGGAKVNQYTLIMDLFYPATSASLWRALWQTDPQNSNGNDADLYINPGNGIGTAGVFDGTINGDTWHRVAFVVDLAAPSTQRLGKFIDGVRVGTQSLDGIDSRWSVPSSALLFTTGVGPATNTAPGCVNSIQFVEGRLSDETIAGLGKAGVAGIPTALATIEHSGPNVTIRWKPAPDLGLEKATSIVNPAWQQVPNTLGASSHSETLTGGPVFYRLYKQ